ncbi:MAG: hypothetical protein EYC70_11030 [Planctomycetota bacterium]|nr:MAG: hypothetical protein EYC70_11030 [Planctomycetota bacterium]
MTRRGRAGTAVALGVVAVLACGGAEHGGAPAEALWLLDGVFLAPPPPGGGPLLLCGRFEVTRAEFQGRALDLAEADLPAAFVSREDAAAWAAARGLRLPTLAEWRHCATVGSGLQRPLYPWGSFYRDGLANTLELGLHRPLPVGVFEHDWTDYGRYDFLGNVWEWVADVPPAAPGARWRPPPGAGACGGSYTTSAQDATLQSVRPLEPGDRAEDIGFRVLAPAPDWIEAQIAPRWRSAPRAAAPWIRRAAARWQPGLRRQLAEELRQRGLEPELCALFAADP